MCNTSIRLLALLFLLFPRVVLADELVPDNLIVQKSACVGLDCFNGEVPSATITIKQNNTRVGFTNTASSGDSWQMTANETTNGGSNYIGVQTYDVVPRVSDGSAFGYDSAGTRYMNRPPLWPAGDPPPAGVVFGPIPAGEVVYSQPGVVERVYEHNGEFRLGSGSNGGVALGRNSNLVNGTVSIGGTGTERRLTHLSAGIHDTDAITLGQMQGYYPLKNEVQVIASQEEKAAQLEDELDGAAAAAAALSALAPNSRAASRSSLGIGLGTYNNSIAVAVGYFFQITHNSLLNLAISGTNDLDGLASSIGFSYQF